MALPLHLVSSISSPTATLPKFLCSARILLISSPYGRVPSFNGKREEAATHLISILPILILLDGNRQPITNDDESLFPFAGGGGRHVEMEV